MCIVSRKDNYILFHIPKCDLLIRDIFLEDLEIFYQELL
jgi:hypothetical protein